MSITIKKHLVKETCTTDISLQNASILISRYGKPSLIVLTKREGNYIVTIYWGNKVREPFEFTGFAWGYSGSGPHGLVTFLNLCGIKVDIKKIAVIVDLQLPKVFET